MPNPYGTGANKSPTDIRTFTYAPMTAGLKGGARYLPEDIEHQHKVGICTGISLTQNARKVLKTPFSMDFQYLCQKKFYDKNWDEGSSIFSALRVGKNIGFVPAIEWTHTTEEDRKLPYHLYIEKLKQVPDSEIERLKEIAKQYRVVAYARTPAVSEWIKDAVDSTDNGILARFDLGSEWWTSPIEPLRKPKILISGHAVTISNYAGGSYRIANTWGKDWADKGTAYTTFDSYMPTEAWLVWFKKEDVPEEVKRQIENRDKLIGRIADMLQAIISLINKK